MEQFRLQGGDWGEFLDKQSFSRVELSKLLLKILGLQKEPKLPLFRRPVKITATFEVATLCGKRDAQCKMIKH